MEKIEPIAAEPPGVFKGRGDHPAVGMLKRRIQPEYLTINVGEDDPIPRCHVPGHSWKDVKTNKTATWLASYKDEESNFEKKEMKYVYLGADSKIKVANDMRKYEKARKLQKFVEKIRDDYFRHMGSKDMKEAQLATATYLIDKLAL